MAVIKIAPTWITTQTQQGQYPDYTYDYDYNYPLINDPSDAKSAYAGFDMLLIRDILLNSNVQRANFVAVFNSPQDAIRADLLMMYNVDPISDNNPEQIFGTADATIDTILGNKLYIDLNLSLYVTGPTRPEYVSFLKAINSGLRSFSIYTWSNNRFEANEVYIELEGNFNNPRPTPVAPVGGEVKNLAETIRFEWQHNSPFEQKSFEINYRPVTSPSWTTVSQESSNQYYELSANTLMAGTYEWRVRTTSEFDFISPWTLSSIFNVAYTSQTPVVIHPTPNQVMPKQDLTVEWQAIPNQEEFEVRLFEGNVQVKQRQRISPDNRVTLSGWLENGKNYSLQVRIREKNQLWSPWVTIPITVQYTAPAKPILHFVEDEELSAVKIYIENPTPVGTEPLVVLQDLYRREPGGDWVKLAENLPANGQFIDYMPIGDTVEYRVNAIGNNLVRVDSDTFEYTLKISFTIVQLANNPVEFVRLKKVRERSGDRNFNAIQKKFIGRKRPVTEFGETQENNVSLEFLVYPEEYEKLLEILKKQETILYRDARKRKLYSTIATLSINDEELNRYSVSMTLNEVDYIEGVVE